MPVVAPKYEGLFRLIVAVCGIEVGGFGLGIALPRQFRSADNDRGLLAPAARSRRIRSRRLQRPSDSRSPWTPEFRIKSKIEIVRIADSRLKGCAEYPTNSRAARASRAIGTIAPRTPPDSASPNRTCLPDAFGWV